MNNDSKAIAGLNCWTSYAIVGALFSFEIITFPTTLPSFEDAIFDSKLESVGPTLSRLLCALRRNICVKYDIAPLLRYSCASGLITCMNEINIT